jgi:hypothetical protein
LLLFKTPTAQLAINGGSQHPSKRRAGGHGPTLADEVEKELALLPTPNATDYKGSGRSQGRARNGRVRGPGDVDLPEAISLLPTPAARDYRSGESNLLDRNARPLNEVAVNQLRPVGGIVDWGRYARAVLWWEQVFGRLVPCPLEPGRTGNLVLAPPFVEWMMGLDRGWVTDLPISRNAKLKLLGNGVVPQQVALGLSILLPRVPVLWKS